MATDPSSAPHLRIGQGLDIHRFTPGKPLVLGGVEIPHTMGLLGHSDADVLLHAITDAVLGALSWGDIGTWFPPSDPQYKGSDSRDLFSRVWSKCAMQGWTLVNCDCVVVTEEPRLAQHIPHIRACLAQLFSAPLERISVKAKTMEHLGPIGRGEGMAATAAVLLFHAP